MTDNYATDNLTLWRVIRSTAGSWAVRSLVIPALPDCYLEGIKRVKPRDQEMARKILLCFACLLVASVPITALAQDTVAKQILARFRTIRPDDESLAMYRLDWAESLESALERSSKGHRPIFLVIIHAKYGDISAGHC